jgi:hypothetical protein
MVYKKIPGDLRLVSFIRISEFGMESTYLSDIFVCFIASSSQPGESEDCTASKDTLAVGLDALLPIIF